MNNYEEIFLKIIFFTLMKIPEEMSFRHLESFQNCIIMSKYFSSVMKQVQQRIFLQR